MPFVKSSTSQVADDPDFEAPKSKQKILPYTEQRKQIKLDQHTDIYPRVKPGSPFRRKCKS